MSQKWWHPLFVLLLLVGFPVASAWSAPPWELIGEVEGVEFHRRLSTDGTCVYWNTRSDEVFVKFTKWYQWEAGEESIPYAEETISPGERNAHVGGGGFTAYPGLDNCSGGKGRALNAQLRDIRIRPVGSVGGTGGDRGGGSGGPEGQGGQGGPPSACAKQPSVDPDYAFAAENDGVKLFLRRFVTTEDGKARVTVCPRIENRGSRRVHVTLYHRANCDDGSRFTSSPETELDLEVGEVHGGDVVPTAAECYAPCAACASMTWGGWAVKITPAEAVGAGDARGADGGSGSATGGAAGSGPAAAPTVDDPRAAEQRRRWEVYQAYKEREAQRAVAANQFNTDVEGAARSAALGGPEGGNDATGRSWRFHLALGGGFPWVPVFADKTTTSCYSTLATYCDGRDPTSERDGGGGVGVSLEMALDPVFAPHYGVGFYGRGAVGAMAAPGSTMLAAIGQVGAQAYVGSDASVALVADVATSWRSVRYNDVFEFYDPLSDSYYADETVGSATYRADRLGGGLRLCLRKQESDQRFCKSYLQALVAREMTPTGDANVYRLEMTGRGMVTVSAELGFGYPAAGAPTYAVDSTSGTYVMGHVGKSFDVFGKPKRSAVAAGDVAPATVADWDADGIADAADRCPESAENDGVSDGCPDVDGDRIYDYADRCPTQAADGDGCPRVDRDGDGLLDDDDKCPAEPESKNDIQDQDGCPEADTDLDGLVDAVDLCPAEAEDRNGIADSDGCPDAAR